MHSGFFPRSFIFRNWHDLASYVSKCCSTLLVPTLYPMLPLSIIFTAYVANIIPTHPGNIPTTPTVEHPPAVLCSSPQIHR